MKKYFLACFILSTAYTLTAANNQVDLKKLQQQQQDNFVKIYKLRLKLISSDKELKALHERIMVLHSELAVKINERKAMRQLLLQQHQLEQQIAQAKQRKSQPAHNKTTSSGKYQAKKSKAKK